MELENHHSATIIAVIHSEKKHQWILKLLIKNEMRIEIFTWSQSISS